MRPHYIQSLAPSLLSLITSITLTYAQTFKPQGTSYSTSVYIENKAMYILGGEFYNAKTSTGQTFSIDLSKSWSVFSPVCTQLPSMVSKVRTPSALIDNATWYVLADKTGYLFDISSQTWSSIPVESTIMELGRSAVYNPTTRRIYIPNGNKEILDAYPSLLYLDFSTKKYYYLDTTPILRNIINYSSVWAPTIDSVLIFGGQITDTWDTRNDLFAYSISGGWKNLVTSGPAPSPRSLACMVSAYAGTKMILFGGANQATGATKPTSLGDIYILDVATLTWTKGTDAPSTLGGVYGHSCAYSNDQVISWGGYSTLSTTNDVLVYNVKTSSWTENYVALNDPLPNKPTASKSNQPSKPSSTNPSSEDTSEEKSSSGPIIAGVVGGVAAIALLVGLFIYHKRSKKNSPSKPYEPVSQDMKLNPVHPQNFQAQQQVPVYENTMLQVQPQPQVQYQNQQQPHIQYQYQQQQQLQVQYQNQQQPQIQYQNQVPINYSAHSQSPVQQLPLTFNTHPQPQVQYVYYPPADQAQTPYTVSPPETVYQHSSPVATDTSTPLINQSSPIQSEVSGNYIALNNQPPPSNPQLIEPQSNNPQSNNPQSNNPHT